MKIPFLQHSRPGRLMLVLLLGIALPGCEGEVPDSETLGVPQPVVVMPPDGSSRETTAPEQPSTGVLPPANSSAPANNTVNPQFSIDNNQYVFDVTDHSREELMAVLKRADEIATDSSADLKQLNVALILHGPDISWFDKQNYEENKDLVDLAAKLDALEVIDMKVCQQSMQKYGIADKNIPAFIDRVAYAPDEITRLQGSGYFEL